MGSSRSTTLAMTFGVIAVVVTLAHAQDRMEPVEADTLTEAQKKALAGRPGQSTGVPKAGSARYLIRVPEIMPLVNQMVDHVRHRSVMDQRLSELVILVTVREWSQPFQWHNHVPMAKHAGLKDDIIEAIAQGRRPERMAEDEEALYDFCLEIQRNQSVSDQTYERALAKVGEAGIVEALHIQGLYAYLARFFNVLRHATPPGMKPELLPFHR